MRLLAVSVVAAVLVACTNKVVVVEAPPPHECASTFEGTWHVLDKLEKVSVPAGDCAAFESRTFDATIDAQIAKWTESGGATYGASAASTCATVLAEGGLFRGDGMAFYALRSLQLQSDGSLKGRTEIRLVEASALDAGISVLRAPAACTATFETTAAR